MKSNGDVQLISRNEFHMEIIDNDRVIASLTEYSRESQINKEDLQILEGSRLLDDYFMTKILLAG